MVIYMIWCETTEMLYIGQTAGSLQRRIDGHRHEAARGTKPCRLYDEIRLLGWDAFEVFTLERCSTRAELNARETWWIEHTSADDPALGYNVQKKANNGSIIGAPRAASRGQVAGMSAEERSEFFRECGKRGAARSAASRTPDAACCSAVQPARRGRPPGPLTPASAARLERKRLWAHTDAITAFTLEVMRRDPDFNLSHLRGAHDLDQNCVIEGFRNIRDFAILFNPLEDRAVLLRCDETELRATNFEEGIALIDKYMAYLHNIGMVDRCQYHRVTMASFREIEQWAAAALGWMKIPDPKPRRVHAELDPPLRVSVRAEFLHDMDPSRRGEFVPGRAFTVSSYPESMPTFQVLLDNGSVFSYLPVHALVSMASCASEDAASGALDLPAEDLCYHACRSGNVCVHRYRELDGPLQAYFRRSDRWVKGQYVLTLEWYEGNDLLHLCALEQGQYAFLPQHKITFGLGAPRELPPYRKLHAEWTPR